MALNGDAGPTEETAALKQAAARRTGLDDFGDPFFERPLAAWVHDLKDPRLNSFARDFLHRLIRKDLERRLKVLAYMRDHPEILEVEIPPVVMITSSPRTGSTLLHNLMALHPLGRPLLRWELMEPLPPPEPETYAKDPRINKLQSSIEPLRGSLLEKMHWVNAGEPEENAWGFIDCTGLLGCGIRPVMPTWSQWLADNDLGPTFLDFRKILQLLIWKCPPPTGGHLVLKCVMTTLNVQRFANAFPEAKFVVIHRDPFRALVSTCTSGNAICRPFGGDGQGRGPLDREGARGQESFNLQKRGLGALIDFARAESARVHNVRYSDLMDNAVSTTGSIYEHLDMPIPEDLEKRILVYLEAQRSGKRAAPPKRLDTCGYDPDAVWADPDVARYCEFFKLEPELVRLTDTRTGT